jgi:ACS family glucarate transporter-like MFS transporter
MMHELGFSQIQMGRLFSAFLLGYALFQVPAGMLADRWGAPRVLGIATLWWVVATGLIAATGWGPLRMTAVHTMALLLVLRFVLGVGESPTFPASGQGVAQWIAPRRQGRANGLVIAAIGLGSAIAPVLISVVMVHWGWRPALLVSALPAMAAALVWRRVPHFPAAVVSQPKPAPHADHSSLRSSSFVILTVSYTLQGYVGYIFVFWIYLYLVQERHFSLLRAGGLSSLPWILTVVAIPLGGVISDRLVSGAFGLRWGRRAVPLAGLALGGLFLVLGARSPNAYWAVGYLSLATALVLCSEGPFWATMMEIARSNSGAAGGIMNMGSNIGGLVSPALTPILAAHLGWKNALYVGAGISVVSAALWLGVTPRNSEVGPG